MFTCVYLYVKVYIYAYVHVCMYLSTDIHKIHIYADIQTHTRARIYGYIFLQTHIYVCIYVSRMYVHFTHIRYVGFLCLGVIKSLLFSIMGDSLKAFVPVTSQPS